MSPDKTLFDDLVSLIARLALDPAQSEAIFLALEATFDDLGDRLLANVEGDFQPLLNRLRDLLQPAIAQIDAFMADLPEVEGLGGVAGITQVAAALAHAAEQLTIQQLREYLATFVDILENDAGLTPAFLEQEVFATLDGVIAELEQIPAGVAAEAQATRRAAATLLRRIKVMLTGRLTPQPLNADRIAGSLLEILRRFGWDEFAETGGCLAGNIENLMTVGSTLAGIAGEVTFGDDSVGAAAAPSTEDQYRWYATWLLKTRTRPVVYSFLLNWLPFFPPDEVWLDKDNTSLVQRNVFRDDTELHSGTDIDWPDAPLFSRDTTGEHYLIERLPHDFMEGWSYHTGWLVDAAKGIAHLATIEGGNVASHLVHFVWNTFNLFWKLATRAPFNSWINAGFGGPQWTRWLLDFAWPTTLTLLASLEGRHTEADEAKAPFWLILLADDVLEAAKIDAIATLVYDLFLSTFTLVNYDGPVWDNPADDQRPLNKEHVDPWVTLGVYISNQIMIGQFPRDRYTYPTDTRRSTVKPDQNTLLFAEWWLGWNTLSTLLGVIAGWLVACAWNRTFDLKVLGVQAAKQVATNLVMFWLALYGRENNTDDGKYNPRGAAFDGYPGHDNSPYKLPYEAGKAEACVQGNQGMWSHNDFAGNSQVYAFDFALDQDRLELAARSGTVVDYFDWVPNDQHPSNNVNVPNLSLTGHTSRINAVDFNHEGTRLATASADQTVRIWNVVDGAELQVLNHSVAVNGVAFNHDGTQIAAGCDNGEVKIWNPADGTEIRTIAAHGSAVHGVAFNHDGSRLATAGADNTAKIFNPNDGSTIHTLTGHTAAVRAVAFNHDGTRLATASADDTARTWDVAAGTVDQTFAGHGGDVLAVAFNHDGTRLATASADNTARTWDAAAATVDQTFTGHSGDVNAVAFSADGTRLATAGSDNQARVWNAADGSLLVTFTDHTAPVLGIVYHPTEIQLATASEDQTARIWWQLLDGQTTADTWNFVLIRHDNPFSGVDPAFAESAQQRTEHDKGPGGVVIQSYGVYGHGRTNSVREILEPCRVAQGLPSIIGLRVKQGAPLMRSGNTGHSFVNHLHFHVAAEPPSASPAASVTVPFALGGLDDYTIPIVFQDVGGDGVPRSLAFYTSGNARQECT